MNYSADDYQVVDQLQLAIERNKLAPEIGNYLFDVLMHRLSEKEILRGYMLYWVKFDRNLQDVHQDLHFRCRYKPDEIKTIIAGIQSALHNYVCELKEIEL